MNTSWKNELSDSIRHHLSGLCDEKVQQVVTQLIDIGVENLEDCSLVTEGDLLDHLKPLQARKLLLSWKAKGSGVSSPMEPPQAKERVPVLQDQEPALNLVPLNGEWVHDFDIPWDQTQPELRRALKNEVPPTPSLRRRFIHIVVQAATKISPNVSKRQWTVIAKKITDGHPKSFIDTFSGEVIGSGYDSLLRQLISRYENQRRMNSPQPKKVVSKESKTSTRYTYGCLNPSPPLPEEETEESLETLRESLKQSSQSEPNAIILEMLNKTYYAQRKAINDGLPLLELKDKWPYLFKEVGMETHFQNLLGIPLKESLLRSIRLKGPKFIAFFRHNYKNHKKICEELAEFEKAQQIVNNDRPLLATIIHILGHVFAEDPETLMLRVATAGEVGGLELPPTPCLIAVGPSVHLAGHFMVAVDGIIINKDMTSLMSSVAVTFSSYFILGIHYPTKVSVTLEFIQRCFFKINPEKGTKSTGRKKKVAHTHPLILKFIAEFSAFELLE